MSENVQEVDGWAFLRRVNSAWQAWVEILAGREAGTAIAWVRMALGLVTLHTMTAIYTTGVIVPLWANKDEGGIINLSDKNWLVQQLGGPSLETSQSLLLICTVACVLLVIGLGSRLAAFVALQTSIALFSLHPGSGGGHDRLITNMLWLLVFVRSDTTLSLWCYFRNRSWTSSELTFAWVRYALAFQVTVMYWATGLQKMGMEWMPWGGYDAVYFAVLHPAFARFDHSWVADFMPLIRAATAVTWIWEVTFPVVLLWLWYRRTRERGGRMRRWILHWNLRSIYVLIGLGMHGTVWVLMDVGPFSPITCTLYLSLFHPDEYARLWQRLRGGGSEGVAEA
jgi:uncharacterized membrane protein YphA (DoxX/SURF4 family)